MPKKKGGSGSLGSSLIRHRFNRGSEFQHADEGRRHVIAAAEAAAKPALVSVVDQSDLEELLTTAELAGREFAAQRGNAEIIYLDGHDLGAAGGKGGSISERREQEELHRKLLTIPRRPKWSASMTSAELDASEKAAFLEWRRSLSAVEENNHLVVTPFEKNLDIWRQLWRVLERSHLVVTVVDSRDPLFYRCSDLEAYVHELGVGPKHSNESTSTSISSSSKSKDESNTDLAEGSNRDATDGSSSRAGGEGSLSRTLLLLNKADLLPAAVRRLWAEWLKGQGVEFAFWSAKAAAEGVEEGEGEGEGEEEEEGEEGEEEEEEEEEEDESEGEWEEADGEEDEEEEEGGEAGEVSKKEQEESENVEGKGSVRVRVTKEDVRIHGKDSLLRLLEAKAAAIAATAAAAATASGGSAAVAPAAASAGASGGRREKQKDGQERVVVGFVGYPNVGKSSTINALVGSKKTGVTSTPGKTKHFQTLPVSDSLMLCDCPGLVFPSFASARSEMVAAGVLPVDRITDQRGPVEVVARKVPRTALETIYGLTFPPPPAHERPDRPPKAAEILKAYARSRGHVVSSGLPDETRAARIILKDYLSGKLPHFELPPGCPEDCFSDKFWLGTEAGGGEGEGEGEGEEGEFLVLDAVDLEHFGGMALEEAQQAAAAAAAGDSLGDADYNEDGVSGERNASSSDSAAAGAAGAGVGGGGGRRQQQPAKAEHKKQKKQARSKKREWRVGRGGGDGEEGAVITVRGVVKPLSHGAVKPGMVLPGVKHLVQ
ncbi:unnamed protein product [Closterium sp. NIES-53]